MSNTKVCPYCKETIPHNTSICPYCDEQLKKTDTCLPTFQKTRKMIQSWLASRSLRKQQMQSHRKTSVQPLTIPVKAVALALFSFFAIVCIVCYVFMNVQKRQEQTLQELEAIIHSQQDTIDDLIEGSDKDSTALWSPFDEDEAVDEIEYNWDEYFYEQEQKQKNIDMMTDMCLRQGKVYSPPSGICIDLY